MKAPCLRASVLLLALRSMTRHKDQHDAILTRRRGDTEAHPPHRTEPEIAGSFSFIRTQGHNNKHARHGIRLCHGTESVVLCTHSTVNDEEPFFVRQSCTLAALRIKAVPVFNPLRGARHL
jgi:hypothetical protein